MNTTKMILAGPQGPVMNLLGSLGAIALGLVFVGCLIWLAVNQKHDPDPDPEPTPSPQQPLYQAPVASSSSSWPEPSDDDLPPIRVTSGNDPGGSGTTPSGTATGGGDFLSALRAQSGGDE
ncbi:hypothetical protein HMPREF9336_04281 [Segniliparus rugosus ATCC BAA-974]|uniref:Uncharacterized protein n=1 Tax=Segniliparus rugosus (strain ATCC BAA-974 / DSM 45345 / CCUG 50838 / CIP 108380 / JCM 13579 / CDC 945) TaxID=679197 RepID=U1M164_SEGRC|nr:hypothetical protein HMPREF9336_04281 [Segniliparus rugosus ATCC BAA-974]